MDQLPWGYDLFDALIFFHTFVSSRNAAKRSIPTLPDFPLHNKIRQTRKKKKGKSYQGRSCVAFQSMLIGPVAQCNNDATKDCAHHTASDSPLADDRLEFSFFPFDDCVMHPYGLIDYNLMPALSH